MPKESVSEGAALLARLNGIRQKLGFIGDGIRMHLVYHAVLQAGPTSANVFIWGESGTGKELAARAIHELSPRVNFPFVALNCAALPEALIESELFGYDQGAFTGAANAKLGYFELARGGTLFFDEIAEMPLNLQAKLLRVLESKKFMRLGGVNEITTDCRVIAATNQHPEDAIREKKLRQDLFYRLNIFTIQMPALRENKEDIPTFANFFVKQTLQEHKRRGTLTFSGDAMNLLTEYHWPGNIRELKNVCERAALIAIGGEIQPQHLSIYKKLKPYTPSVADDRNYLKIDPNLPFREIEKQLIRELLRQNSGDKNAVAKSLGISLKTLYNKIHAYNLEA